MKTGRPAQARAAVYCRISRDEAGDQLGVKRQEKDCRALVHTKGWTVAEVFIDDDISAYKAKRRPGYEAMLEGVRAGSFDAIVCWKLDRLTRSGIRGLTQVLDALDGAGASLVSVTETLDTSSAMGEGIAGLLASVAKSESEALSLRSRRKKDELAERGLPAGYSRSFGYVDNGMTICEPEAMELRRAAELVLAGESLSSIARDWNTRGVLTPRRQKQWGVNVVRRVLINPRNAGLRVHRGDVVGPAAWDAIIDIDTHRKLVALLTDPSRKLTRPRRRSLLTGIVRCGVCAGTMIRDQGGAGVSYRCRKRPNANNCGTVNVVAAPVDEIVTEAVFAAIDSRQVAKVVRSRRGVSPADRAARELSDIEGRLDDLADLFAKGEISRAEWSRARKGLVARQAAIQQVLVSDDRAAAVDEFLDEPGALRRAWDGLSLDRRRAIIAAVLDHVTIAPASVGARNRFNPRRVVLDEGSWLV